MRVHGYVICQNYRTQSKVGLNLKIDVAKATERTFSNKSKVNGQAKLPGL